LPAKPHGIEIAGIDARLTDIVKISDIYIVRGSFVFSPNLKAVVGAVGVNITSTFLKADSKSSRILVLAF